MSAIDRSLSLSDCSQSRDDDDVTGCDFVTFSISLSLFPSLLSLFPSLFPSFSHFFHHLLFAGAVGTLVSGTTDAPCWSMSAASYVSPSYDPSPPKSGFGVSEGDPIMWWPPTKLGSTSPIFGSVESLSMNVPLGKSPQVQVRLADGTVRSASAGDSVRRKRRINALSPGMHKPVSAGIRKKKAAAAAAAHIHMREKRGESLSLKAQAARSSRSSKLEELEMIEIKTPTGKLLKMEVTSRETPGELKHRLEETLGPVGGHRVVFAGKSLEEDKTLGVKMMNSAFKNDEFRIKNGEMLIKHDEFCFKHVELCDRRERRAEQRDSTVAEAERLVHASEALHLFDATILGQVNPAGADTGEKDKATAASKDTDVVSRG